MTEQPGSKEPMKKLIVTLALEVSCLSAFAQGQPNFANFGAGANAPVYDQDGVTKLAGSTWLADLYWAPGVVTDSNLLNPLGAPASFASSGYFFGGSRTITGQSGGAMITGQVRVWNAADGGTWEFAASTAYGRVGVSALFAISLTAPPATPNSLAGLTSFRLRVLIPEPSVLALTGIGLAGMLVLRERK